MNEQFILIDHTILFTVLIKTESLSYQKLKYMKYICKILLKPCLSGIGGESSTQTSLILTLLNFPVSETWRTK